MCRGDLRPILNLVINVSYEIGFVVQRNDSPFIRNLPAEVNSEKKLQKIPEKLIMQKIFYGQNFLSVEYERKTFTGVESTENENYTRKE